MPGYQPACPGFRCIDKAIFPILQMALPTHPKKKSYVSIISRANFPKAPLSQTNPNVRPQNVNCLQSTSQKGPPNLVRLSIRYLPKSPNTAPNIMARRWDTTIFCINQPRFRPPTVIGVGWNGFPVDSYDYWRIYDPDTIGRNSSFNLYGRQRIDGQTTRGQTTGPIKTMLSESPLHSVLFTPF